MERTEQITFSGTNGNHLSAKLDFPTEKPKDYALFAHCFACSKDLIAEARISRALTQQGIAVFRFDFSGLGQSDGEFADTNFTSNIEDILAAADYLRRHYEPPKLLIGHSLGGTAMLAAATHISEAIAVATIASPSDPKHIVLQFEEKLAQLQAEGCVKVQLGGRELGLKKQFLEDLARYNILERLPALGKALLIFHSPKDATVSVDHARKLYEAASHPKSFICLHQADHLLTNKQDALYVADILAAWAKRYAPSEV